MLAAGLAVTAAMTIGMIVIFGGIALGAAFARDRFMGLLDRTEGWRRSLGRVLEVGSSLLVLVFGLWMASTSLPRTPGEASGEDGALETTLHDLSSTFLFGLW